MAGCDDEAHAVDFATEAIAGDYKFTSSDGQTEVLLRLRAGGQFWHAAHRRAVERCRVSASAESRAGIDEPENVWRAYKDFERGMLRSSGDALLHAGREYQSVPVWEIAESLGSWRALPDDQGTPATSSTDTGTSIGSLGRLLELTCTHWSWKCSHDSAPSNFKPTPEGEEELDAMVDAGQLVLCYSASAGNGARLLQLQAQVCSPAQAGLTRHARMRNMQAAFQTLGFASAYLSDLPEQVQSAARSGGVSQEAAIDDFANDAPRDLSAAQHDEISAAGLGGVVAAAATAAAAVAAPPAPADAPVVAAPAGGAAAAAVPLASTEAPPTPASHPFAAALSAVPTVVQQGAAETVNDDLLACGTGSASAAAELEDDVRALDEQDPRPAEGAEGSEPMCKLGSAALAVESSGQASMALAFEEDDAEEDQQKQCEADASDTVADTGGCP